MGDFSGEFATFGNNAQSNITDAELTSYMNLAVTELWNMMMASAPDGYSYETYYFPIVQGVTAYPLPPDFQAVLGCDVFPNSGQSACFTILPFNIHDRNKYSYGLGNALINVTWSNIRYATQDNNLIFIPPQGNLPGNVRLLYQKGPPILCQNLPTAWVATTNYTIGALVYSPITPTNGITYNQTFQALNTGTSGTLPAWNVPGTTTDNNIVWVATSPASQYATSFDGIAGYEEIPVLECAIKMGLKQEEDVSGFLSQKDRLVKRINLTIRDRNAGDPQCISPAWGNYSGNGWDSGNGSFGI